MAKDTVSEWIKVHPQFSDAVARARVARISALEAKLLRSRKGAETSAVIFALRNADPTECRDIKHTERAYAQHVNQLTDAQLYAIASQGSHSASDVIHVPFARTGDKLSIIACNSRHVLHVASQSMLSLDHSGRENSDLGPTRFFWLPIWPEPAGPNWRAGPQSHS